MLLLFVKQITFTQEIHIIRRVFNVAHLPKIRIFIVVNVADIFVIFATLMIPLLHDICLKFNL